MSDCYNSYMPLKELVKDRLWEYENFLTDDEVDALLNIARATDEPGWRVDNLNPHDGHYAGKSLHVAGIEGVTPKIEAINRRIEALFTGTKRMVPTGTIVRNSETLHPVGLHRDNEDENMIDNRNAECRFGILVYLNSDFDGGEICYPEYGIEYKPKRGVLLIHHAGNLHGVHPVSNGTRYSMTSFAWGSEAKLLGI
jgi:hypothetical protein